jgi:PhnB protein
MQEAVMAKPAKNYRPEDVSTVTPYLTVSDGAKAIEFYKKAFGARETARMNGPDGKIMHAQIIIGDSTVYLADQMPGGKSPEALGGTPVSLLTYWKDCDAVWRQVIAAGAKEVMPLSDQFWGDRFGQVKDPFGHVWSLATQKEELTEAEIGERAKAAFANMPQPQR